MAHLKKQHVPSLVTMSRKSSSKCDKHVSSHIDFFLVINTTQDAQCWLYANVITIMHAL